MLYKGACISVRGQADKPALKGACWRPRMMLLCGAASGCLSTGITFPMDTIRRRMQIQNLHIDAQHRLTARQQLIHLVKDEGLGSLYQGLTPEMLKVIPMVGTMFLVYEWSKEMLDVKHNR